MNKTIIFHEYEFTCKDLDGGTCITDVLNINAQKLDDVEMLITDFIKDKHEITTLTGNTWILEEYSSTGKTVEKNVSYNVLTQRFENKIYPIINEL